MIEKININEEFKKKFFQKVAEVYPGDIFPVDLKDATDKLGDGLAAFIRRELEDIDWEGEDNISKMSAAESLLQAAINDIHRVFYEIATMKTRYMERRSL